MTEASVVISDTADLAWRQEGDMKPEVTVRFMLIYTVAQYTAWTALLTPPIETIALRIAGMVPAAEKGVLLGNVLAIGALGSLVATPIWGAISDRTTFRFGRRGIWMLLGALCMLAGLSVMAFTSSIFVLGVGWLICQIGSGATQASLNAVLPDVVPDHQRGRMSGLLGLTVPLAILSGTVITMFTSGHSVAMFLVPWLPAAIALPWLVINLPDRPAGPMPRFSLWQIVRCFWVNPISYPDFFWAFVSRFLLMLGFAFSTAYQVYFLIDQVHIKASQVPTYVFRATLVSAALVVIITPAGGWISDKIGRRKPFVFGAALIVALGLAVVSLSRTFTEFLVAIAIIGVGEALYIVVDMALCVTVLPKEDDAAKDLGILQMAQTLPQTLAPAIAPFFLVIGDKAGGNYFAVFIAASIMAIFGALTILPVKKSR